jgi:hypothetical protein
MITDSPRNRKISDNEPAALSMQIIRHPETHLTKLRNYWSRYGEDTLLLLATMLVIVGLYLLFAYLFITTF